jgi:hypothetical protein
MKISQSIFKSTGDKIKEDKMAKEVKTTVKKAAVAKKTPIKKKVTKGQSLACEVCGLSVTVEEIGNLIVEEDSVLLCCGKPMKAKAAVKKAVKK